ncbi:ABC transporter ATP-binding protein [Acidiferrimicrobium sp. IK]|nr:ABC transporter ATP-binding protein [Acidiferrimicrobium sp. IK]
MRLRADGITVQFGGLTALDKVDLEVAPGAICGLVGPNGAGKSTLFAVLSGLLRPTAGTVWLDGEDITGLPTPARARRGLARTFQHPELFSGLTIREHLILADRMRYNRRRLWGDLVTMGGLRRNTKAERERIDALIQQLGLGPVAGRPAVGVPLGIARLIEVGRALAVGPSVVLLDEPSSGLDRGETEALAAVLRSASEAQGVALVLVEHDVDLVFSMCSTVTVIDFGVRIACGAPATVRSDPAVRAAYLGEEPVTPGVPA